VIGEKQRKFLSMKPEENIIENIIKLKQLAKHCKNNINAIYVVKF